MEIGFMAPTRRFSAARQTEDLTAAGATVIETDWEIARQHVRPGFTLWVVSLHLLAPDWSTLMQRLRQVAEFGGVVRVVGRDGAIDPASAAALASVRDDWQDEKLCRDPAEMRRRGKRGGRPKAIPPKSDAEKMVKAWRALDKSPAETVADLKKMHGLDVSEATVKRIWAKMK